MVIIKIGGGGDINLTNIIKDLKNIDSRYMIVHGANSLRDKLAEKSGYKKRTVKSISGYSSVVSNKELIDLQMMSYAGLRNKRVVELCQQEGINAIGMSGLDGKLIEGKRNRGIKFFEDGKKKIIRDLSGKPEKINTELLNMLMANSYVPVITVPIIDENGYAINSENDDIVSLLQKSFNAEIVIHLIEASGFLNDSEDEGSVIKRMSKNELLVREEQAEGRIKRKLYSLKKMFENRVKRVIIADGRIEKPIRSALEGKGTIIE